MSALRNPIIKNKGSQKLKNIFKIFVIKHSYRFGVIPVCTETKEGTHYGR